MLKEIRQFEKKLFQDMVVIWFVSTLSGGLVSLMFAIPYIFISGNWIPIIFVGLATVTWVFALVSPLSFPLYKGIMPALFPMVGLLFFGFIGFGAGWLTMAICHAIADTARYSNLSKMTGGTPPSVIVPLQTVGVVIAGAVAFIILLKGQFFLNFTHHFFLEHSNDASLLGTISLVGSFFAGTRQFFVCMTAFRFARIF